MVISAQPDELDLQQNMLAIKVLMDNIRVDMEKIVLKDSRVAAQRCRVNFVKLDKLRKQFSRLSIATTKGPDGKYISKTRKKNLQTRLARKPRLIKKTERFQ
jgi:hypothetical protein